MTTTYILQGQTKRGRAWRTHLVSMFGAVEHAPSLRVAAEETLSSPTFNPTARLRIIETESQLVVWESSPLVFGATR